MDKQYNIYDADTNELLYQGSIQGCSDFFGGKFEIKYLYIACKRLNKIMGKYYLTTSKEMEEYERYRQSKNNKGCVY